jgi:hypothetical protein
MPDTKYRLATFVSLTNRKIVSEAHPFFLIRAVTLSYSIPQKHCDHGFGLRQPAAAFPPVAPFHILAGFNNGGSWLRSTCATLWIEEPRQAVSPCQAARVTMRASKLL